jgi:hypothetical protein
MDFVRREEDYLKLKEAIFAGEIQQGLNLPKI